MKYGFVQSKLDGSEQKYELDKNIKLPEKYSYIQNFDGVINLGNLPICVPCSLSAFIDWKLNISSGIVKNNKVDTESVFKKYGTRDGMTFKDGLHYLCHEGIKTQKGLFKVDKYAMVGSIEALKLAIVMNGPCIGGLPVKNSTIEDFWNGYNFEGGHAIAIVGYDKDGFIIRNSWGKQYGTTGYGHLPYSEFNNFYEVWTLIKN